MGRNSLKNNLRWEVELHPLELTVAANTGITRRVKSREDHRADTPMKQGTEWQNDICGAIAEMALAKALNVYWVPSVDTFKLPDIGTNLQVRSTTLERGKLIVRPRDSDDEIYVLGIEKTPLVSFKGWMYGKDAKNAEHWFDPRNGHPGAWFVAQDKLRNMNELEKEI